MLRFVWVSLLLLQFIAIGCRSGSQLARHSTIVRPAAPASSRDDASTETLAESNIVVVSAEANDVDPSVSESATARGVIANNESELQIDSLIATVLERNPSLQAAIAAWSAAVERYPQVIALDDPMFQSMFAPATFSSTSPTQTSYYIGAAQKLPWHGKRQLRGEMARWEAVAASWTSEEAKQRLVAATRLAYFDDYLVHREIELNDRNIVVMEGFRNSARAKYEANQVSQQDVSAAELELAMLDQKNLDLRQLKQTIVARLNTLLHYPPDHELPPPVRMLAVQEPLPDVATIRELAWHHRPELSALAAKMQSEQNALLLACKEYYPDFEVMGRYDAFWTNAVQRPQVGVNMNLPLNQGRRGAAVREAQFRLSKLRAEYDQQTDLIAEEVQVAISRVESNQSAVRLFQERILEVAETNLNAAVAAYEAGTIDFLRLMGARKLYIDQQITFHQKLAEYHRSRAELERSIGAPLNNSSQ